MWPRVGGSRPSSASCSRPRDLGRSQRSPEPLPSPGKAAFANNKEPCKWKPEDGKSKIWFFEKAKKINNLVRLMKENNSKNIQD